MERLLEMVSTLVSQVSPAKAQGLAKEVGQLADIGQLPSVVGWGNTPAAKRLMQDLDNAARMSGVSPERLAGMISGASYAYQSAREEEHIELVWTGPDTGLVSTRRTEQALLEVIEAAQKELFMVSFVAYEVPAVMAAMNKAIARGVKVSMLIETSDAHGGKITVDSVAKMKASLPGVKVYEWDSTKKQSWGGGSVHAKCSVADGRIAFITSANLTSAALERNMELGVLARGSRLPKQLLEHLEALATTEIVC